MKNEPEKVLLDKKPGLGEMFVFTDEDGKVKSLDLVYALCLGLTILFVYYICQHLITLGFEKWFSDLSRAVLNFLDIGVSAVLSTAVFCAVFLIVKNKKPILMGYLTALAFTLVVVLAMLIKYPKEALAIALPVVVYMFLIPVAFGFLWHYFLWRKLEKKNSDK